MMQLAVLAFALSPNGAKMWANALSDCLFLKDISLFAGM